MFTKNGVYVLTNYQSPPEESRLIDELTSLDSLWKPLLIVLRFTGLYHFKHDQQGVGFWKLWCNPWKIHSIFALSICIWMLYLDAVEIDGEVGFEDNSIYIVICKMSYHTTVIIFVGSLFLACHYTTKLKALYDVWSRLRFKPQHSKLLENQVIVRVKIVTIVTCFVTVMNCAMIGVEHWLNDDPFHIHKLASYFEQIIECFSIAFVVIVCRSIMVVISMLSTWLLAFFEPLGCPLSIPQWNKFHSNFNTTLQLITAANGILGFCLGWGLFAFLIQTTLFTSIYLTPENTTFLDKAINIWWTVYVYFGTLMLFWNAAEINAMINTMLFNLSKAYIGKFSIEIQNELIFFQNRLWNNNVGICIFNLHLVTRGMATSIAGIYATYLIMLVQMKG